MFQRFFDEGLAQASFLVGCDRTKQAVVIDPRRDASVSRGRGPAARRDDRRGNRNARARGLRIGRPRARGDGRARLPGPGADLEYPHHDVHDGEELAVGDLTLTFLHTPGHTPEHISILAEAPGMPARLFTGDLLFVGGVGRPDLLGEAQTRRLANDLFDSLQRIMAARRSRSKCIPATARVRFAAPASARSRLRRSRANGGRTRCCNTRIATRLSPPCWPTSPDTPPYFARMKRIEQGRAGAVAADRRRARRRLPSIGPAAAAALAADGALILDLRSGEAFAEGHPYGALNIAYGPKIGYWAGWVVPPDVPLLLLADEPSQAQEAAVQLLRVGLDRIEGAIPAG